MSDSSYPSDRQDKFMLRLPDGMRDRIKRVAEINNRSMNAEIVAALEDHFPDPRVDDLHELEMQMIELEEQMDEMAKAIKAVRGGTKERIEALSDFATRFTKLTDEYTLVRGRYRELFAELGRGDPFVSD